MIDLMYFLLGILGGIFLGFVAGYLYHKNIVSSEPGLDDIIDDIIKKDERRYK